jgi:hypothetical protein
MRERVTITTAGDMLDVQREVEEEEAMRAAGTLAHRIGRIGRIEHGREIA